MSLSEVVALDSVRLRLRPHQQVFRDEFGASFSRVCEIGQEGLIGRRKAGPTKYGPVLRFGGAGRSADTEFHALAGAIPQANPLVHAELSGKLEFRHGGGFILFNEKSSRTVR